MNEFKELFTLNKLIGAVYVANALKKIEPKRFATLKEPFSGTFMPSIRKLRISDKAH